MKRIISLALSIIMLLSLSSLFSACNKSGEDETPETTASESLPDTVSQFLVSDLSKACIIYPTDASETLRGKVSALAAAIKEKLGVELKVRTDYVNASFEEFAESEYEILVGRCANREESESFGATVRIKDFGYSLVGKKIVICGGTEEKTVEAISHFTENIVKTSDGKADSVFLSASMGYMTEEKYDIESVMLGGSLISEYVIVYPSLSGKFEQVHAQRLADSIEQVSGYVLRVKSDELKTDRSGKEIRIGATDRNAGILADLALSAGGYHIGKDSDGAILVVGKDTNALYGATENIISAIKAGGEKVTLDFSEAVNKKSELSELTVMTYNVLTGTASETRYNNVVSDVLSKMPDSVGFQEVSSNWMTELQERLGEHYAWVGVPRGDGGNASRGEYSCIFYRKALYTLKDSGTKWLSDTPDQISKYDESGYHRIMTWAKLERKSDGKVFVHVNTHLAHEGNDIAATKQAKVLVKLIDQKFSGLPVVLTGDFNTDVGDLPYKTIAAEFTDSKFSAIESEPNTPTFKDERSRLDIVFINDMIYAMKYDVINDRKYKDGETSDHYPVILKYLM